PPRLLLGERGRHRVPVEERVVVEEFAHGGKTRAMTQQIPHRQLVLARLGELGPVLRHGRVDVEQALVGEAMRADRGDALGGRVDVDERVARPRLGLRLISMSRPDIHDASTVEHNCRGGADLVSLLKILGERVLDTIELRIAGAFDFHRHEQSPCREPRRRGEHLSYHAHEIMTKGGLPYAIAPPQLEPAPAVHPKQCEAVAMRAPTSSPTSSISQIVDTALPPSGISSIWLKSQS